MQKLNLEPQQTEFMKDWVKKTTQCSHATIGQINMYSDNQASIRIVSEPFHHDNTNNMKRGPHVYKHSSRNCRCANRKTEVKSPRRTKWNHKYLYQLKGEYRIQDFSPELWTLISWVIVCIYGIWVLIFGFLVSYLPFLEYPFPIGLIALSLHELTSC